MLVTHPILGHQSRFFFFFFFFFFCALLSCLVLLDWPCGLCKMPAQQLGGLSSSHRLSFRGFLCRVEPSRGSSTFASIPPRSRTWLSANGLHLLARLILSPPARIRDSPGCMLGLVPLSSLFLRDLQEVGPQQPCLPVRWSVSSMSSARSSRPFDFALWIIPRPAATAASAPVAPAPAADVSAAYLPGVALSTLRPSEKWRCPTRSSFRLSRMSNRTLSSRACKQVNPQH